MPAIGRKEGESYLKTWQMEPLPIAQLVGLTPKKNKIKFFDDRVEDIDYTLKADLVAITLETYTAKRAYEIAAIYRKKGVKVVMGGFHATLMPEEVKDHCDSVVIGEAEEVWKNLLKDFENKKLKQFYKSEKKPSLAGIKPYRKIFKGKKYLRISLIETARGCNFSCNFCSISSFYNGSYRARPIKEVVNEIKSLKNKLIFFIDDNIAVDSKRSIKLFKALKILNIKWFSQMSINTANDTKLLKLMRESGCLGVLIGFESLSKRNLKLMGKSWNKSIQSYDEALRKIKDFGFIIYATFIFGYGFDDEKVFKRTYNFAMKHKFFLSAFNHLVPFPGTPLYSKLKKENRLLYKKWWLSEDYKFGDIAFKPKKVSPKELADLCQKYRQKFYTLNSTIKRASNIKCNLQSFKVGLNFFLLNLLFRKETVKRKGLILGKKKNK